MKNVLLIVIAIILTFSISSFNSIKENNDDLIAVWVYSDYENKIVEYVKANKFKNNASGIEFRQNGEIIKRQNVGWCGTPPITYGNYNGSWMLTSDSTLTIKYDYWGGKAEEDWQIVEQDSRRLKIKGIDYRTERK